MFFGKFLVNYICLFPLARFARLGGNTHARTLLDQLVPPQLVLQHSGENANSVFGGAFACPARRSRELAENKAENQSVPTATENYRPRNA